MPLYSRQLQLNISSTIIPTFSRVSLVHLYDKILRQDGSRHKTTSGPMIRGKLWAGHFCQEIYAYAYFIEITADKSASNRRSWIRFRQH